MDRRERNAEYMRRMRVEHPEREREAGARYRAGNPERHFEYQAHYRRSHLEEAARRARVWRKQNRPWLRVYGRASRFANQANRRAAGFGAEGVLTATEVREIAGPCRYCGGEATSWDHVVPLSRKGPNTLANLVPSCSPCNRRKGNREAPPAHVETSPV